MAQQKTIFTTAAASTTLAIVAAAAGERNAVLDYAFAVDNTPATVAILDGSAEYGRYRMNTSCPPLVVHPLPGGQRFTCSGTISLSLSTSCVVTGHITVVGV